METNIVDMTPKRVPLKIKRATDTAKLPSHGSNDAAGWDLFADITEDVVIPPHENRDINTGLIMEIPTGYWGGVYPRSGIARKENLRPANTPGCIDSDYRGIVLVVLHNDSDYPRTISPGERVA
jgi:dUTP pyrophosphatase